MKRLITFLALTCAAATSFAATLNPVQLLNPAGSTAGQAIVSTGSASAPAWGNVTAATLAPQAANTVVANATSSVASPSPTSLPNCLGSSSALTYTAGSGFGCNATINATTLGGATFSSPGPIGSVSTSTGAFSSLTTPSATIGGGSINNATVGASSPSTGAFTTLSVSGAVSGAGFTSLLSPYATLSSPTFTGVPAAPTAAVNTNTTQLATTAFVQTQIAAFGTNRNQPYFQAYLSSNQSFTAGTATKVQFNTKNYDSGTYYDNTTNYRFTPLTAGKYRITVHVTMQGVSTAATQYAPFVAAIYKNGVAVATSQIQVFYNTSGTTLGSSAEVTATIALNGTTDYIEGWGNVATVGTTQFNGGASLSYIEAYYMGP